MRHTCNSCGITFGSPGRFAGGPGVFRVEPEGNIENYKRIWGARLDQYKDPESKPYVPEKPVSMVKYILEGDFEVTDYSGKKLLKIQNRNVIDAERKSIIDFHILADSVKVSESVGVLKVEDIEGGRKRYTVTCPDCSAIAMIVEI